MKIINLIIQVIKRKESPLILTILIAGISLIGWLIGKIIYASFSIKYIPIAHSSAIIFIAISLIFIAIIKFEKSQFAKRIAMPILLLIIIYCSLILLDFIFDFTWDLENIFINNPEKFGNVPIGRMSPISSLLIIFTCLGIWGIRQNISKLARYVGGGFSLIVCIITSVLFIGYLYKAPLLYGSDIIPVSLPSVICFLLISITLLRLGNIKFWTFNLIQDNTIYHQLLKSFLPIVIFIVILQGFLTSNFSINQNNPTLTSAIILFIVITVTIVVVIRVSAILGNRILKAENTLRESEERYKRITNGISDYLYTVKVKDGKAIETIHNEACFAITGYTSKDFKADPYLWINMVVHEERELVAGRFLRILEGENLYSIEHRIIHKNGSIRWINDTLIPKYDANGDLISYDGIIKDITDRKIAEEALRLRESYLSAIIEDLPGLLWLKDQKGKFLAVNTKFSNSCGLDNPELLIGKTDFDIWTHELADKYVDDDTKVMKSGKPYFVEEPISIKGELKWFETFKSPIYDKFRTIIGTAGYSHDITERKLSEIFLKEKNEQIESQNEEYRQINEELHFAKVHDEESLNLLRNVTNNIPAFIAVVDADTLQYKFVNMQYLASFNKKREDIIGSHFAEVIGNSNAEFAMNYINEVRQGKTSSYINTFDTNEGKRFININYVPGLDEKGDIKDIIVLGHDVTSIKETEGELIQAKEIAEESEERFRAIFENSQDAIGISWNGINVFFNKAYLTLFDFENPDEIIGKPFLDQISPKEYDRINEYILNKSLGNEAPIYHETIGLRKNGEEFPFEINIGNYYLNNEKYIIAIIRDITQRKVAEDALTKSEERFKTLSSIASEGIMIHEQGKILDVNFAFAKLAGYSNPDELIGRNAFEIIPLTSESKKIVQDYARRNSNDTYDIEIRNSDGSITPAETRGIEIVYKGRNTRLVYIRDITERKKSEKTLRDLSAKLETLIQVSPLAIILIDNNGNIQLWNKAAEDAFGWTAQEVIGHHNPIVPADKLNEYSELSSKILEGNPIINKEAVRQRKDGSFVNVSISSAPVFGTNGEVIGRMAIIADITQQKLAQEELIKAKEHAEESDRLKTAFLQNMSHEIRTPMNAIMGFSSLLVEHYNNKTKLEKFSEIINRRCVDLLDIINDILDIAKIESGQLPVNFEECNLNSLFAELKLFYKEQQKRQGKQNINFNLKVLSDQPDIVILTDKVKLKQIFINLISNAFKFTEKGKIEGGCKFDSKNNLIFYVSDTGIGIPADKQQTIFERFSQINSGKSHVYGGTGLGLSIVKGLVGLLGGELWLDSAPDKGSTFSFTIKHKTILVSKQETETIEEPIEYYFPGKNILIVEDELYNAEFLKEILTGTGMNVEHTELGIKAVNIALNQPLDMILMDIRLPDIDGYDAIRQIRKSKPNLKIIAQTAYATQDEKQKAIEAGCNDYISKPINLQLLLSMISKHLSKRAKK